jgi:small-conductance mechanosensitive channel
MRVLRCESLFGARAMIEEVVKGVKVGSPTLAPAPGFLTFSTARSAPAFSPAIFWESRSMGETNLLGLTWLDTTIGQWLLALGLFLLVVTILRLVASMTIRRLESFTKRTRPELDDFLVELLRKTKGLFIILLGIWTGSFFLTLSPENDDWLRRALGIGLLVQGALWAVGVVNHFLGCYRRQQAEEDPSMATALGALGFVAKAVVWAIFVLLILQNLGVEITAILAGVSVGGIAVALAVQNVLGDLFGSLSIILDKPFVIGDFIVVGEFSGTVEHVGLKSTHIRSVSGEQLVFSNSDLLGSRIRNYKRMQERRVVFTVGVTYDTPPEALEAIPGMVRGIVEAQDRTRFDRCHFKAFNDSSLDIETVFFMTVPDYDAYMDVQQAINLELFRRFAAEGIEFAFPTQTIFVEKDG